MEKFDEIVNLVNDLKKEKAKVEKGVRAARIRLRVGLLQLKKLSDVLRKEINKMD